MISMPASNSSPMLEDPHLMPSLADTDDTAAAKPRIWTVFATWLAALAAGQLTMISGYIAVGVVMGFILGAQGMDSETIRLRVEAAFQQPLMSMLLSLVPFQIGMLIIVMLAARWSKQPMRQRLGLVPSTGDRYPWWSVAAMAAFSLSTALAIVLAATMAMGAPPMTPIAASLSESSMWGLLITSVLVSLVPAVVEEMVFRGYMQRRLLLRWSPTWAIAMTTLLFALVHADSLQHMLAVVPLSIATGLLAHRTESILPGMLLHLLHNAGAVKIAATARLLNPTLGDEGVGMLMIGSIIAMALIGLPAVLCLLWPRQRKNDPMTLAMPTPMESFARGGNVAS